MKNCVTGGIMMGFFQCASVDWDRLYGPSEREVSLTLLSAAHGKRVTLPGGYRQFLTNPESYIIKQVESNKFGLNVAWSIGALIIYR